MNDTDRIDARLRQAGADWRAEHPTVGWSAPDHLESTRPAVSLRRAFATLGGAIVLVVAVSVALLSLPSSSAPVHMAGSPSPSLPSLQAVVSASPSTSTAKTPIPPYPDTTEPTFGPALVRDGDFQLSLTTDASSYEAGQPISVQAEFLYSGGGTIQLISAKPSPLGWGVAHADGTSYVEPDWSLYCGNDFEMAPGVPMTQSFTKFNAPTELDAKEARDWLGDPDLRLPAGQWVIYVAAMFGTSDCGQSHLQAATHIVVH